MDHTHDTASFVPVADLFRRLGDPTRVYIFWLLCHNELSGIRLASRLRISTPAVAHHLRSLRESGLIVSRREGKEVCYRAADTESARLLHRVIEQVMDLVCPQETARAAVDEDVPPPEGVQEELIRAAHDYLSAHLDRRIPMSELCRRYGMNPTALKEGFKKMYGRSPAAHIKAHRMERAAELLCGTDLSVGAVAAQVGYDSQSKFTAAFKDCYGLLPREFRRAKCGPGDGENAG